MKMINISRNGDQYIIKTINSTKVLGMDLLQKNKSYQKKVDEEEWFELSSGKTVSAQKKLKLDKWLKDHQKFIEHQ